VNVIWQCRLILVYLKLTWRVKGMHIFMSNQYMESSSTYFLCICSCFACDPMKQDTRIWLYLWMFTLFKTIKYIYIPPQGHEVHVLYLVSMIEVHGATRKSTHILDFGTLCTKKPVESLRDRSLRWQLSPLEHIFLNHLWLFW
jgi:hypothetical protein